MATAAIGAGISAVTGLIGAGKQSQAIKNAAAAQTNAATTNAALDKQATTAANTYTEGNLNATTAQEQPYVTAGDQALSQLSAGTAAGGEFNSMPTSAQVMAQDPGYQFTLEQGQQSLQRAEAAGGGVGSGGALKAASQYATNLATTQYSSALSNFMSTRQANYSNLAGIANYGQTANQVDANARTAASANVAGTTLSGTAAQTGALAQGANATAAGDIGVANAQASALSGIGTAAQQAFALSQSGYGSGGDVNTPTWNPATGTEQYPTR